MTTSQRRQIEKLNATAERAALWLATMPSRLQGTAQERSRYSTIRVAHEKIAKLRAL